jgi:hypothetical protein
MRFMARMAPSQEHVVPKTPINCPHCNCDNTVLLFRNRKIYNNCCCITCNKSFYWDGLNSFKYKTVRQNNTNPSGETVRTRAYYKQRLLTNTEFSKPLYNFLKVFWIPMAIFINPLAIILVILPLLYFGNKMKEIYPEYFNNDNFVASNG